MRLIVLAALALVAAVVFAVMLCAIGLRRATPRPDSPPQGSALAEYLWTLVPWAMMAMCVWPAVRRILAD